MAIYTRTGDKGMTSLFGGRRLSKADIQIDAYGTLDELTCTLGIFILHINDTKEAQFVEDIQKDLYVIMGFLANAPTRFEMQKKKSSLFEKKIDALTAQLPSLKNFILPGGSAASCWAHMARVSCRKVERVIILYFQKKKIIEDENVQLVLTYLNRLSDLLFTYARAFNTEKDIISKQS
jgi:cob(I)alamin adenosyltransferase